MPNRVHSHSTWAIEYRVNKAVWGLLRTNAAEDLVTFRTKADALLYIKMEDMKDCWEAVELIPQVLCRRPTTRRT